MSAQVYLCIECHAVKLGGVEFFTHTNAKINAGDGTSLGSLQMLGDHEVKDYAKWCALAGSRDLLDAFELQLINSGMLRLWPDDEAPEATEVDEWEALEMVHADDGLRIVWEPRKDCPTCEGSGFIEDEDEADDPWGNECPNCCGGKRSGALVITDADGRILQNGASA
jgi:hypothetical protein